MAGSESTAAGTEYGDPYEKKLPISPVTPIHQGYVDDAVPYLDSTPVRPNAEMAGSSPDPTGFTPELSGVAAPHQPAELSPNPERLGINRSPAYEYGVNGNTDSRTPDRSVMRSNLNLSNRGHNRRAHNGRGRHVMSWMEYDGSDRTARPHATDVSPTSGVWSGTNSSTARNSGVSQDSPTLGWQQERRIRGRGEAEAIREEGAH